MRRYQFHPKIHEAWGNQDLYFWFFTFGASYDKEEVFEQLEEVLEEHHVTSHVAYELIGQYDLLLRVWLPYAKPNAFKASLQKALGPHTLKRDVGFPVAQVIRHWPFAKGDSGRGELVEPEESVLAQPPDDATMARLNRLVDAIPEAPDPDFVRNYADDLKVVAAADQGDGIKLVTLVQTAGTVSNQQRVALQKQLARTLDELDPDMVSECSLYWGSGVESWLFLIMCRISGDRWGDVRADFLSKLQLPLIGAEGRTTTYVVVSADLLIYRDVIELEPKAVPDDEDVAIRELLQTDESHRLEVKATAFSPIDPWLRSGSDLEESDAFFDRSVLKSVTAFLNADGGTVVIGALEAARYRELDADLDKRLSEFPEVGQYLCCGLLDPTFTRYGWDKFERRLLDLFSTRITPNLAGYIRITKESCNRKPMCVIRVDAPTDDQWFYARPSATKPPQFFVRDGARTLELDGADADMYKKRKGSDRHEVAS